MHLFERFLKGLQTSVCSSYSLCCGIIELVLSGTAEAGLNASIFPQSLDDPGQFPSHEAFLSRAGQHKQLTSIILHSQSRIWWYSVHSSFK